VSNTRARRSVGVAATVLLLAAPAFCDWRVSFREGVKASDQGRWEEVVRHMSAAIEERPSDDRDKVSIFSNRFLSYIPNAYLGMALAKLGRCEEALPYFDQADVQRVAPDREPQIYRPMLEERARCINKLMATATGAAEKALAAAQRAAADLAADAELAAVLGAQSDLEQRRQQAMAELQAANEGAVAAIQGSHLPSLRQAVDLAQKAEQSFVALRRDAAARRDSGAMTALRGAQQEAQTAITKARAARDVLAGLRRQPAADSVWRRDQAMSSGDREAGEQLDQAEALASKSGAGATDYERAIGLAERALGAYDRLASDLRTKVAQDQRASQEAGALTGRLETSITAAEQSRQSLLTARERPDARDAWARTPDLGRREQQLATDLETARRAVRGPRDPVALRAAVDLAAAADRGFQDLAEDLRSVVAGSVPVDRTTPRETPSVPVGRVPTPPPALLEAVDAYFRGDYPRTLDLLEDITSPPFADPRVQAQAHLFRAAASFAVYSLEGDESQRRNALDSIRLARSAAPDLQPSDRYFPPPFLELFRNGGGE
jgi:tetratricopeptide (TPR) repeat protein